MTMMKKKKILVGAASAIAALSLMLSGCSASGSSGSKPDTLQVWLPPTLSDTGGSDTALLGKILAPWEKKNHVKVKVTIVSWESYEAKMLTGFSSGAGPDVTYMYNEMVGDYINRGELLDLGPYLTSADKANFLYLDKGQVNGKQYMLPYIVGGARVLYYNKDVLSKAGVTTPPTTWDQFTSALTKVKDAGMVPFLEEWGDPNRSSMNETFYPSLYQAGGHLLNPAGTATAFNTAAGVKAASFIVGLKKQGLMPGSVTGLNAAQVQDQFNGGKVGFIMSSDSALPIFTKAGTHVGVVDSLKDVTQGTFVAVDSLVVPKACKDPKLCVSLVRFIESGPVMTQIHKYAPYEPVGKDEKYTGAPEFAGLYKQTAMLHQLPVAAGSVQVYNILYKNLQQMMLGEKSPKQALSDASTAGDAILAKNKK
jgi:multiple sugar transport system substrate-binding protein